MKRKKITKQKVMSSTLLLSYDNIVLMLIFYFFFIIGVMLYLDFSRPPFLIFLASLHSGWSLLYWVVYDDCNSLHFLYSYIHSIPFHSNSNTGNLCIITSEIYIFLYIFYISIFLNVLERNSKRVERKQKRIDIHKIRDKETKLDFVKNM